MRASRQAFTIMELSIVVAIIGLLVGGIIGGRSMIHASHVRKVVTDAATFAIAAQQFKQQYEYLPGDFPSAEQTWGSLSSCTPSISAVATGKPTCNGNGNGFVDGSLGEMHRYWQHLANASYIQGRFTGATGPNHASASVVPGLNAPTGALRTSTYSVYSAGIMLSNASYFDGDYSNVMQFGAMTTTYPMGNVLTGAEAFDIDTKSDDGKPGFGQIRTYKGVGTGANSGDCASTDVVSTASYKRAGSAMRCSLFFLQEFKAQRAA